MPTSSLADLKTELDDMIRAAEGSKPLPIPLGGILVGGNCLVRIPKKTADALVPFLKRIRTAIKPYVRKS